MRRQSIQHVLLAGAAAAALLTMTPPLTPSGGGFVRPAAAEARIQIGFFFDALAPYGDWVRHPRYDYVFVPAVDRGWRPYTYGHWVYTDRYGWYWESDEPYAWAVYHYGRWGYDPAYGWFWVPGTQWAPAWVTWRHGGGHVGWAPCAPRDAGYVVGYVDYYEPPIVEAWVFVPERRFVAVNIVEYVVPVVEVNVVLRKTRDRYHVRRHDGFVVNDFLPRDRVRTIVKQEINIYNISEVEDRDDARRDRRKRRDRDRDRDRELKVYRPQVAEAEPDAKPKRAVEAPEEIKKKPTLRQTARGEKPEDAPPSAAELKPGASAEGRDLRTDDERRARTERGQDQDSDDAKAKRLEDDGGAKAERRDERDQDRAARDEDRDDAKAERRRGQAEDRKDGDEAKDQDRDQSKAARSEEGDDAKAERRRDKAEDRKDGDKAKDQDRDQSKAARRKESDDAKAERRKEQAEERGEKRAKQREERSERRESRAERRDDRPKPSNKAAPEEKAAPKDDDAKGPPRRQQEQRSERSRRALQAQDKGPPKGDSRRNAGPKRPQGGEGGEDDGEGKGFKRLERGG